MRDTDADWRRIGETQPYWGVLTHPEFRTEALTTEALDRFYLSGRHDMEGAAHSIALVSGRPPSGARGLDFGCGVGRLTEAMLAWVDEAVGVDVSPGMLAKAEARGGRGVYTDALPDGPFDWINSVMVLQHIPPARGLALLSDLLARLAPDGAVSLHLTSARHPSLPPQVDAAPPPPPSAAAPSRRKLFARRPSPTPPTPEAAPPPAPGVMVMYDYDLNRVADLLREAGVGRLLLTPSDHGGHYGYTFFGRRAPA